MRLQQDRLQVIKNYLHAAHACLIFLAIILTIAVYTRNGASDGRTGWFFGLCWLTIPVLIYLVMVPMWPRAQRFANVYAFAILDLLFTVLWLSAWASVASYISGGGGCDNFSLGSDGKCKLSEGAVVLGVFIMVLFGGTSYLSLKGVMQYRRTGMISSMQKTNDFEAQTSDAFSPNIQKDDFEDQDNTRRESYPAYEQQAHAPYDPTRDHNEQYVPLQQADGHVGLGVRYD